jgi:CrcB protein
MNPIGVIAVAFGAAFGALLRWWLGLKLNAVWPDVPMGTLAANLIGGYLIGIALGILAADSSLHPAWRLFIVTGFLGGLTTFSTFSAETVALLQRQLWSTALGMIGLHLVGSLAMTAAGLMTVRLWRG